MSAGLSLIFGLMNVVNVAHGSFFMLGAFFALAIHKWTGSFWAALALSWIPAVAIGVVMERVFIRKLYARGHLDQVLLTFGFTFVFVDLVRMVWGADIRELPVPEILSGVVEVVAAYRLRNEIRGEFWLGFAGVLSLLFGMMLILRPGAGALTIVWLIASYTVLFGVVLIAWGMHLKRLNDAAEQERLTHRVAAIGGGQASRQS